MNTHSPNSYALAARAYDGMSRLMRRFSPSMMLRGKRKAQQHPGTYVGCKKDKFASMTRQRRRAEATKKIMAEVKAQFQLPRRVLRAIVRTRVNRDWRQA